MRGDAVRRWGAACAVALVALAGMLAVVRVAYPLRHEASIVRESQANALDPFLVIAVVSAESRFRPDAVSRVGAVGLMQLMPNTAAWVAAELDLAPLAADALNDPETNLRLGVWYLRYVLGRYQGNERLALAAYNAGPTAVDRWRDGEGALPEETRRYVDRVLGSRCRYRFWYTAPVLGTLLRAVPL